MSNMKKLVGALFLFTAVTMQAQYVRPGDETNPSNTPPSQLQSHSFADNLSIGGSFGLDFGQDTYIELEPLLSYHFNQSFMAGIGPIYQYESVTDLLYGYSYSYSYSTSIYGGRIAALYFLPDELSKIFIMGEFDVLNVPEPGQYTYQVERGYISLPMLGIGYKEMVSEKVFFCIYGLWNFNNSPYSPYINPLINVGLDVGLGH